MARKTRISLRNSLSMRPEENDRPAKYHRGHLDTEWQQNLIREHQPQDAVYLQKVERLDPFRFVYHSTDNASHRLDIIDCKGVVVLANIAQMLTVDVPGNTMPDGSQLHSYLYRLSDLSAITEDGQYYALLTVLYDLSHEVKLISHPFWLKDSHPGTMMLEYFHTKNLDWDYFEWLPVTYRFRVEAYIGALINKSVATVYQGQGQSMNQLDRTAYREWPVHYGESGEGIPDYVYDKLNHIYDCDTVYHDGKQYIAAVNATWEKDGEGPLFAATINVSEPVNPVGTESGRDTILLYLSPLTFGGGGVHYGSGGIYLGPNNGIRIGIAAVIDNTTQEDAYVAAMNTAIAGTEFTGTVVNNSGSIEYVLGDGDTVDTATALIYSLLAITFHVTAGGALVNPTATFTVQKGHGVIDWGHVSAANVDAGNTPVSFSHVYPTLTAATYTVRIFANSTEVFGMDGGLFLTVDSLAGVLTQDLKEFELSHFAFSSNQLDMALFANTPALQAVAVTNSGLTSINNLSFLSGVSAAHSLPMLRTINLSSNAFTSSAALNVLRQVLANVTNNNIIGGDLYIVQSPTLSLGFSGGVLISGLNSKGWTVHL